jgi:hypothetical protein
VTRGLIPLRMRRSPAVLGADSTSSHRAPGRFRRLARSFSWFAVAFAPMSADAASFSLSGAAELEWGYARDYAATSTQGAQLAKAALSIDSILSNRLSMHVSALYEEGSTPLELDEARASFALGSERRVSLDVGQFYLGIGQFETFLLSDPLTLEIGEERERAVRVGVSQETWFGRIYAYDSRKPSAAGSISWGGDLGFERKANGHLLEAAISAIGNLGGARRLQGWITPGTLQADVPAWSSHIGVHRAGWHLLASWLETLKAFDGSELSFNGAGARPRAWQLEIAREFGSKERKWVAAVSYQESADALSLEFPRRRLSIGLSKELGAHTHVGLEWIVDRDYAAAVGGTGREAQGLAAKFTAEF